MPIVDLTFAKDIAGGRSKLNFTAKEDGGYEFDTGILRGRLRDAGKCLGLTSAVHVPTGTTLDVETIVKAGRDLSKFEVFLASYFHESFPLPKVLVTPDPKTVGKRTFMTAKKSFGNWQMFPRDYDVVPIIRDGRWKKKPNPVDWKIMPAMAMPIALRRGDKAAPAAILMAPPDDCFAISTPYEGEGHYSTYFSLFGHDIEAGQTARARLRLVVIEAVSNREILNLYEKYMKDLSELKVQTDNP